MANYKQSPTEPTAARRLGYAVTIIILLVLLYVFLHLYDWKVPFITAEYNDLLWYIRGSFYASIASYAVFLIYDPKWFRHLLKAVTNIFSSLSTIMFFVVFPFNFPTDQLDKIIRIILLVVMIISLISILIELIKAIRHYMKRSEAGS